MFSRLPILSVVSMELLSTHKMAEIRPAHGNESLPDPRIGGLISDHRMPSLMDMHF